MWSSLWLRTKTRSSLVFTERDPASVLQAIAIVLQTLHVPCTCNQYVCRLPLESLSVASPGHIVKHAWHPFEIRTQCTMSLHFIRVHAAVQQLRIPSLRWLYLARAVLYACIYADTKLSAIAAAYGLPLKKFPSYVARHAHCKGC